jgi:hypothetical protein
MKERCYGPFAAGFCDRVAIGGDEVGVSMLVLGHVLEATDGLAGGGFDGGLEVGHVCYVGDGLVCCVVFYELVWATEVISSCYEGLGSAGAEVHIAGINIIVDSGDVIRRIVRDPGNGDDGFAGCVWVINYHSGIKE